MKLDQAILLAAKDLELKLYGSLIRGFSSKSIGGKAISTTGINGWLIVRKKTLSHLPNMAEASFDFFRKPKIFLSKVWEENDNYFYADFLEYVKSPVMFSSAILSPTTDLPDVFFEELKNVLERLASTPSLSSIITLSLMRQKIKAVLGRELRTPDFIPVTVHGDLHWSNIISSPIYFLDWEKSGLGPYGLDQAMLLVSSLANPKTFLKMQNIFASQLESRSGLFCQIYAACELLDRQRFDLIYKIPPQLLLNFAWQTIKKIPS